MFYLKFDEIRETMTTLPEIDRRELVALRKGEIAHFRTITPPPTLGTMPPGPPPDDPASRTILKFFGGPPQPPTDPGFCAAIRALQGRYEALPRLFARLPKQPS